MTGFDRKLTMSFRYADTTCTPTQVKTLMQNIIIIDTRRTTLEHDRIEKSVHHEIEKRVMIKRVILINKSSAVVEISR